MQPHPRIPAVVVGRPLTMELAPSAGALWTKYTNDGHTGVKKPIRQRLMNFPFVRSIRLFNVGVRGAPPRIVVRVSLTAELALASLKQDPELSEMYDDDVLMLHDTRTSRSLGIVYK